MKTGILDLFKDLKDHELSRQIKDATKLLSCENPLFSRIFVTPIISATFHMNA